MFTQPPAFMEGIGIGLAVAAPVGPMAILLMRRTLDAGWSAGAGTGLGIACGDAIYALIAALGLAGITRFMLAYDRPLHVCAGVFLIVLAVRTLSARTARDEPGGPVLRSPDVAASFGSALLLTLTNPPTIVSFAAIFTALAPRGGHPLAAAVALVFGVFIGSLMWWALLTATVSNLRHAVPRGIRGWLAGISAAILGILGAAEIRRAL